MVLSDRDIAHELGYGDLEVEPVNLDEQLQPCSLDIRLGREFKKFTDAARERGVVDTRKSMAEPCQTSSLDWNHSYVIQPGDFVLANTKETFTIPDYLGAELRGRSSFGRLGLEIHSTAGWIDAGFSDSELVLEISNVSPQPIRVYTGQRIGQIVFYELSSASKNPYNEEDNKYQGQKGAVPSRINEEATHD